MTTYSVSLFSAPIAPYRTEDGREVFTNLTPVRTVGVELLHRWITSEKRLRTLTEQVRAAPDLGEAKKRLLPFITPSGTFGRRNAKALIRLSGLLPVDIDKLDSPQEAAGLRDRLAADRFLHPVLTFVSPSGKGVKAFVPYHTERVESGELTHLQLFEWASLYIEAIYGRQVDPSGKDLARACFLCHDPEARLNL